MYQHWASKQRHCYDGISKTLKRRIQFPFQFLNYRITHAHITSKQINTPGSTPFGIPIENIAYAVTIHHWVKLYLNVRWKWITSGELAVKSQGVAKWQWRNGSGEWRNGCLQWRFGVAIWRSGEMTDNRGTPWTLSTIHPRGHCPQVSRFDGVLLTPRSQWILANTPQRAEPETDHFHNPVQKIHVQTATIRVNSASEIFEAGIEVIINDILFHGKTAEEHNRRLERTLWIRLDAGVILNMSKCRFRVPAWFILGTWLARKAWAPTLIKSPPSGISHHQPTCLNSNLSMDYLIMFPNLCHTSRASWNPWRTY